MLGLLFILAFIALNCAAIALHGSIVAGGLGAWWRS